MHKKGASLPVPQAPRFAPEPGEYQAELIKAPTKEVQALFEQPNERHADLEWGRIMQELEAQLHMDQCGRGWYFPVIREPLVPQLPRTSHGKGDVLRTGNACNCGLSSDNKGPSNHPNSGFF